MNSIGFGLPLRGMGGLQDLDATLAALACGETALRLRLGSAGGSDADDNLTSPCTWCHLHGIHGGRIRALGTANHIRWELGPRNAPSLVVYGRERMVA